MNSQGEATTVAQYWIFDCSTGVKIMNILYPQDRYNALLSAVRELGYGEDSFEYQYPEMQNVVWDLRPATDEEIAEYES
jgi:hypothetical protein